MRISLIAAVCIALPLLGACGSNSGSSNSPVTAADLSKALQDGGIKNSKFTDCAAKIFVDSGISQDGLRQMSKAGNGAAAANGQTNGLSDADRDKAGSASQKIASQCASTLH
ncbi:MAG: hypothetical protein J2P18_06455 [Nocardia sp.]|nr:hypothetical protein [Nocardia sp.]